MFLAPSISVQFNNFLCNYLLNMFRATSAHHQEFSLLYIQPPVICNGWIFLSFRTGGCMYSRKNSWWWADVTRNMSSK
jgi:hypothetical protein